MPVKTATNFAILGLLSIRPMSAYELVKFSNETIGFFWNESYGNIYSNLKKLEKDGFIQLIEDEKVGRRKKTYAIVDLGKQSLKEWLLEPPAETLIRDELLIKVFMSEIDDVPAILSSVENEAARMKLVLDIFKQIEQEVLDLNQDPSRISLWLLTLDYGKQYAQTRLAWCQNAKIKINEIKRKI